MIERMKQISMLYKPRTASTEILVLQSLSLRLELSSNEKQYLVNLLKGMEGERAFDRITENLLVDCYIINDLLLQTNNSTFQIDSTIITTEEIHLFEIKNYEGDYYYQNDRIYTINHKEISNPINQIRRNETLFQQLLQKHGWENKTITSSVVFINPEFTLYQAPLSLPFIFPTQIQQYLKRINPHSSKLNKYQKQLAEKLTALHITKSPFSKLPPYEYKELKKGIYCKACNSFEVIEAGMNVVCEKCGYQESVETVVLRNVEELKLLFPSEKITTSLLYDWCRIIHSKKRIRRILETQYKIAGANRWSYFE
ncbi:nuclease-related domain-containing protein [Niallia sp.]|uniref:nuclease-related domain-containing protein n=1 Tax=Niallia sp. TaxID=2837523 RepID=UPI00289E1EE5|nr:nuclease-related domain-containing protein [Niallia sp.]